MKYYKYIDEYGRLGVGVTYIEVADGWVLRKCYVVGEECISSNVYNPQWGIELGDQQVDYDSIAQVTPIAQREFESIWNANPQKHESAWKAAKYAYPFGAPAKGYIECFHPQGVIVNLGRSVLGVADYKACESSTGSAFLLGARLRVTAVVGGHDEAYHWIVLETPQVDNQRVPLGEPGPGSEG